MTSTINPPFKLVTTDQEAHDQDAHEDVNVPKVTGKNIGPAAGNGPPTGMGGMGPSLDERPVPTEHNYD